MIRRLLLAALTVLTVMGLAGPASAQRPAAATPPAARPAPAAAAKARESVTFAVLYRRPGTSAWQQKGTFASREAAQASAQGLYRDGFEVQLHAITTLSRVPERPRVGKLDAQK